MRQRISSKAPKPPNSGTNAKTSAEDIKGMCLPWENVSIIKKVASSISDPIPHVWLVEYILDYFK